VKVGKHRVGYVAQRGRERVLSGPGVRTNTQNLGIPLLELRI
jgi:hypothetical protein